MSAAEPPPPGPDGGDAGAPASRPEPIPSAFRRELGEAFRRHRPQNSLQWNFASALRVLLDGFAEGRPPPDPAPEPVDPSVDEAAEGRARRRFLIGRGRRGDGTQGPEPVADGTAPLAAEIERLDTGVSAATEAFRFLGARVDLLEDAARRAGDPVDDLAWLLPSPSLEAWGGPVRAWVATAPSGLRAVHAECGDGRLVEAMSGQGREVLGVDPRGSVAWEAARRGVPVEIGEAGAYLARTEPGSLGALVLSGVVDRLPVASIVDLLAVASTRLATGSALVVLGTDPDADEVWSTVARDLMPGRPLHAETWLHLMGRCGFAELGVLAGSDRPPAAPAPGRLPDRPRGHERMFGVRARWPA
jgi:hypothetical protein